MAVGAQLPPLTGPVGLRELICRQDINMRRHGPDGVHHCPQISDLRIRAEITSISVTVTMMMIITAQVSAY